MRSNVLTRALRAVLVAALVSAVGVQSAAARPLPGVRTRRGFNLRAEQFTLFLVNRIACGINNLGEICVDPGNSPIGGGGFWPKGTPDQYIFNTGVQVAGIVSPSAGVWAGDTVGAYFMDPRGTQAQGDGVTLVYNSLDPDDAANWPAGAVVRDTAVYNSVLIGRNSVSQQDLWVRTWDGNPTLLSGRTHPMGVLVEERGLAWNFPTGNEDILYFIFDVTNITASDPAVYNGLDPAIRADVAAIGQQFHDGVKSKLGVDVPAAGVSMDSVYVAFFADMDVGDAAHNYGTAVLPFNLGQAYKSDFHEALWKFPPDIFGPPFAAAPGFVGVKYLKSPIDPATGNQIGLTLFSNTLNSSTGFPDPVGVTQLWRYLSGHINTAAGDNPCTVANPIASHLCYLGQVDVDIRFYQSSGPFSLAPGQSVTIVVAYVQAPALAAYITQGNSAANAPGIPASGAQIAADPSKVRTIDKAMGWAGQSDVNGDGVITQDEVTTVPRSLLQKSLVAQAIYDNKFLLPFAPEPPKFFLVPGDNQVTIVWQPSATETTGDPFFQIASNNASPLYDPNFRSNDVEGYRIYRGRTPGQLDLVAQFDYSGTTMNDYTAGFDYPNCAPELGVTAGCPVNFNGTNFNPVDLSGNVVQIPPGGRVKLSDGSIFNVKSDTAVVGGGSNFPALVDNGVPFAFIDKGVRSSFNYYYAVTAFDVNSVKSGPSSLESPRITKTVTPQAPSTSASTVKTTLSVSGDDGVALNTAAPFPAIDPDNGTFSGNLPPIKSGDFSFLAAVAEALPLGDISVTIDSAGPGFAGGFGPDPKVYVTMKAGNVTVHTSGQLNEPTFDGDAGADWSVSAPLVPYDSANSKTLGLAFTDTTVRMPVQFAGRSVPMAFTSEAVGTASGRYGVAGYDASRYLAHSRWFDAGGSEPADPTINAFADSSHNAGKLSGVGRIWAPSAYRMPTSGAGAINAFLRGKAAAGETAWYPADFIVTWGAGGKITVRDTTHHVTLPFRDHMGSGYGFFNISNILATGIDQSGFDTEFDLNGSGAFNIINYQHLFMIEPTCSDYWGVVTFACATLADSAELTPLDFNNDGVQDATGIILLVNGEPFFMEMGALPAAGTQWHLRAVTGVENATCTPALGSTMTDCSGYKFTPNPDAATVVPGLTYHITVDQQFATAPLDSVDLTKVHTVPDPYYATNALEISPNKKVLKFVNLPAQCIIRIYSLSGVLVNVLTHNDLTGGGETTWDLRNRNNQFVASGVYFYHLETPRGQTRVGRFTIVNFAQ